MKPVLLTVGERKVVRLALEHAAITWQAVVAATPDKDARRVARLRLKQGRRILGKLAEPRPDASKPE